MSDELNVKISDIKAKFIRNEAKFIDRYFGNNDGSLDKEESTKLARVLSGDIQEKGKSKKLAKESDEVKAIFGLSISAPAAQTEAEKVEADAKTFAAEADAEEVSEDAAKTDNAPKAKKEYKSSFDELKARFLEVMEYDEASNTSNGTTAKQAYKQVKAEYSDKEKYTKEERKEYSKALKELKDYAKHQFVNERAQKTRAAVQAYDEQGNIVNKDNLQYDTSKKVYKREKELTKANNNGVKDKWAKRALRNKNTSFVKKAGRYLSGNDSPGKTDDKAVAAGNKAAIIREYAKYSEKDLTDALGKDNPLLHEYVDTKGVKYENVLIATGLITKDENDEYSVKELSKVVGGAIGADNTLNDHDNHNESEIQAVLTRLYQSLRANGSGEFKTSELTDKQVRKLVKFLGYRDDRAQTLAVRIWQNLWKGAVAGGAAGAAAGAARGRVNIDIKQHQEVSLSMDGFTEAQKTEFINSLKSENSLSGVAAQADYGNGLVETTLGQISATAVGIYIAQDQMVSGTVYSLLKSIAVGALTGAGVGAALGVLDALGSHSREREILGMVFDCDSTYEEIIDTIDNAYSDKHLSPQMKEALKKVAELGIVKEVDPKTGAKKAVLDENCNVKWDYCQFMEAYNNARGNQIFNAAEVRAAARVAGSYEVPDCKEEPAQEPVKEPEKKPEEKPVDDKNYWGSEETTPGTEIPKTDKFEDWGVFASRYHCLEDVDKNFSLGKKGNTYSPNSYARTMMKIMQAVTDTNYDLARLQELTKAAQNRNFSRLQSEHGFNYDLYMELRGNGQTKTYGFDRQNLPTITTVDDNNQKTDACAPEEPLYKIGKQSGGNGKKSNIGNVRTKGTYKGRLETSDGKKIEAKDSEDYKRKEKALQEQKYKPKTGYTPKTK